MKGKSQKQMTEFLFDDREILGLRGTEKMSLIIKIQALVRGAIARKRVK
jgi:hypothetical protein